MHAALPALLLMPVRISGSDAAFASHSGTSGIILLRPNLT